MDWKCKNINTKLRLDSVLMAYQHSMLVAMKLIMKMVYTCYSDLCYVAYNGYVGYVAYKLITALYLFYRPGEVNLK